MTKEEKSIEFAKKHVCGCCTKKKDCIQADVLCIYVRRYMNAFMDGYDQGKIDYASEANIALQ